jgi:hypothetical protein
VLFTDVKISMELLAELDLRWARHPLALCWVVGLKNKAQAVLPCQRTARPGLLSKA